MIDSCDTRILCCRCFIFGMKEESDMHRFLDVVVAAKKMDVERAIEYCVQRWEEYLAAIPELKWSYGGAHAFFTKGLWDHSDAWPWKDGPPRQPGVVKTYKNPDLDRARDEWIRDNRPDLAKGNVIN